MAEDSRTGREPLHRVMDSHRATKHSFEGYARGPGFLDWATQPDPFRRYEGARLVPLERGGPTGETLYDEALVAGGVPPVPVDRRSISRLFYDSLAISAWKNAGGTGWALRVNPSSGNLHPTEAYLICGPVEGLCTQSMVGHYAPREHGLEVRAEFELGLWERLAAGFPRHSFFVALTSIHWREAWKYGQRAYRYCQHDAGHAIGAVGVAAAGLGWQASLLDDLGAEELALLTGTFGEHDAEPEEPDVLMLLTPFSEELTGTGLPGDQVQRFDSLQWQGRPNLLSPSHVDWDLDATAKAARKPRGSSRCDHFQAPPAPAPAPSRPVGLREVIRQRRSAVAMDGETHMVRDTFYRILGQTVPGPGRIPFAALPWRPRIHLAIFVHRVDGLPAGLYLLVRDPAQTEALQTALTRAETWGRPAGCPEQLALYRLTEGDARQPAQQISCFQEIASQGCFSLGMLAEFEDSLNRQGAWFYPRLFWEAGMVGQVLYLEAEAAGLRGTGIGCFFDDAMHEALGLEDRRYQDLYHFTVGGPVEDDRLTTLPAYPDS